MMKSPHWMTAAVLALAASVPAAWAAPVPASSLGWLPADAPIIAHLNGLETLRDHAAAFLKNAVPDRADMLLEQYDSMLKNGVQGRKLAGLAKEGPIFFVAASLNGGDDVAFILAVTDYAAFRDNLLSEEEKKDLKTEDGYESTTFGGKTVYFVNKKDHVVITPSKELAEAAVKKAAGAGAKASLESKMDAKAAARFLASDFSLYVDLEAVNAKFGDQIKAAHTQFNDQLDKAAQTVGEEQKGQIEMGRKMIEPIFQAFEDAKASLVTADVKPDGVTLHTAVTVRSGTTTAGDLKGFTASPFKDLAKLPAGQLVYAGLQLDPAMIKAMTSLMSGAPGGKELAETFASWAAAKPSSNLTSFSYPVSGLSVWKSADPEKAKEASVKMLEKMGAGGSFGNVVFKEKPEVKADAEKYGDISFTSVHMVWDFDKMLAGKGNGPGLPENIKKPLIEGMKKLIGEEVNAWIGVDGKSLIQVTAKDWATAQKMLDEFTKGEGKSVGADKAFAAARKLLPNQATVVALIDAVQLAGDVMEVAKPFLKTSGVNLPPNFPSAMEGKTGFLGFALTLNADGGAVDFVVSAEAVNQIYEGYVSPLLQLQH